jgi:carbon storage regulator CsrA
MLILSRDVNQGIDIDGPCRVVFVKYRNGRARIGIIADQTTRIRRSELPITDVAAIDDAELPRIEQEQLGSDAA